MVDEAVPRCARGSLPVRGEPATARWTIADRPAFALLCVMVFSIPWANTVVFASTATVTRVLGIVTFGVGAITVLATGRLRPLKGIHIMMAVFVWWAALTFYWSIAPDSTWARCWTYARLIGMVWVIWQFTPTLYRIRCLMQALVLGAFVTIVGTFTERMVADQTLGVRFTAIGFDPNVEAMILALCIPFAWHLSTVSRGPAAWLNRLYIPVAMIAIALTASRAGFAAAVVALLIIPWTLGTLSWQARVATAMVLAVVVFGTYSLIPSTSWERISTTPNEIATMDVGGRMEIWQAGLTLVSEHSVVGVGANAFMVAAEPMLNKPNVAHNVYVSVLAECGVVGLALYCAVLLWLFLLAMRMLPAERKLWLMVGVTWSVGAFFLTYEQTHATWLLWGLVAANAFAVDNAARQTGAAGQRVPGGGCGGGRQEEAWKLPRRGGPSPSNGMVRM